MNILIPLLSLVLLGATCSKAVTNQTPPRNENVNVDAAPVNEPVGNSNITATAPVTSGIYTDYSSNAVTRATAGRTVLFFHAAWCPFCRDADADFRANASRIPADVTLLKTDYDRERELKQKYGVTTQHTFVQVDNSGNEIAQWTGGETSELLQRIR